jgi:hypothetical protein
MPIHIHTEKGIGVGVLAVLMSRANSLSVIGGTT